MSTIIRNSLKSLLKAIGLYTPLKNAYSNYSSREKRKNYKLYNEELLLLVDDILTKNGYSYWLNFGTLLGAYRDHAFIPHDDDLDISMFWDDRNGIKDALINGGLNLVATFYFGDYNHPESLAYRFEYKNVYIDLDFHHRKKENPRMIIHYGALFLANQDYKRVCDYIPVQVEEFTNPFDGLMKYDFLGRKFNVPSNIEEYIIANYGPNYRTPDSHSDYHDYAQNIHIYSPEEKEGYIYKHV